jgi:hypothetical protein
MESVKTDLDGKRDDHPSKALHLVRLPRHVHASGHFVAAYVDGKRDGKRDAAVTARPSGDA